jgi:hypothetical protein
LGAPRSWPPTTAQLFAAWPCWHLAPLWSAFAAFGGQWNSQKMSKDVKRETTQNWKLNKTEQNSETGCGWTRIKCHEMSSCGDSWYCSSWIDSVVFLFLYRNIFTCVLKFRIISQSLFFLECSECSELESIAGISAATPCKIGSWGWAMVGLPRWSAYDVLVPFARQSRDLWEPLLW